MEKWYSISQIVVLSVLCDNLETGCSVVHTGYTGAWWYIKSNSVPGA